VIIYDAAELADRDRLVSQIAMAINQAYRNRYNDSVSIVASIEMAEAAIKAIDDAQAQT